jgi:hypothetical protein
MGGFMKYASEMASGVMICLQSFMNIGAGVQKLLGGYTHATDSREVFISLLLFSSKYGK